MNRIAFALGLSMVCGLVMGADEKPNAATPLGAEPAGMTQLFNGKDLTGWDGDPRLWKVQDGVIRGETTKENAAKGNTFLVLKDKQYGDFELRLSFKQGGNNNSGIQYRSKHSTGGGGNNWVVRGYQHEIRNENKIPNVSGFIYDEGGKRGRLITAGEKATWEAPTEEETKAAKEATDPKKKSANGKKVVTGVVSTQEDFTKAMKIDGWNDVVIIAKGNNIKHYLNGMQVIDFTDNHPELALKSGVIALQLHAGAPMWVEFKDIRIKELDGK